LGSQPEIGHIQFGGGWIENKGGVEKEKAWSN